MKVFLSSVRRGLETERDCLPGLIRAIGHEPLSFEEFSAQPVPSREACLRGVQSADVYLLLLGPCYGDPLPETGLSPTHEEYTAALVKGIPRLAFRKAGVDFERAQIEFAKEVESYSTGLFRANFTDAVDLQAKVAAALRDLPSAAEPAVWAPLSTKIEVEWRENWARSSSTPASMASVLDVHAVPIGHPSLSARQLRETAALLAGRVRALGIVSASAAIEVDSDMVSAWACPVEGDRRPAADDIWPDAVLGVRISSRGQRSVWQRLPADRMGSLLDPEDLPGRIGTLLRLLGSLMPANNGLWALAIAVNPSTILGVGPLGSLGRRSSAQMTAPGRGPLRVAPDESVSVGALNDGADQAGRVLAENVFDAFGRWR